MSYNIFICGIGGQGVITLGKIIVEATLKDGKNVTLGENRGHAKRNDSVSCHIRIGKTYSPMIPKHDADLIIALNQEELKRHKEMINKNTKIIHKTKEEFLKTSDELKNYNIFLLREAIKGKDFPISKENIEEAINEKINKTRRE